MTTQNQLLREPLEAYRAAREMPSYGDYASINWQSQQGPTNPAFGGGDCAKHGRWYGHCHCCADDWEKLRKQADRDAVHARDNALRKADELARAALAHPAPGVPDDVVRDAERYRWLRDRDHWPAPFASSQDPEPVRGIDLDAAIDAARKDTK